MTADLSSLWREHQNAPFPYAARQVQVEGMTLLQLDVILGKILTGCLRTDGVARPLSDAQQAELARCRSVLKMALEAQLNDEARIYFTRLRDIAGDVAHAPKDKTAE